MSNTVKLKRSAVASKVPAITDLALGELALNTYDGNLFFKKSVSSTESIVSVVTLDGSQTLTNKTLTSPTISGGSIDNATIGATTPAEITATALTTTVGDIESANALISSRSSGDYGGVVLLNIPQTNTDIDTGVTIDVYENKLRIFENGGNNRGVYVDLTFAASAVGSNLLTGGGGGANSMLIAGDTGTDTIVFDSETLTFAGGTGITSTVTSNTVTFDIDSTVATLSGAQTLTNKTIAAGSNTISGLTNSNLSGSAGITNANLQHSSVTIGSTEISLGSSNITLAGLSSVTSTSFIGALTGNADTVTNGVYTSGSYDNPSWITHLAYSKLSGTIPTWNQDTTGNAATVTNGVYTTGSYSDPSWLTITYSKLTGVVPTWNQDTTGNAGTVTNGVYTNQSYDNPSWITHLAYSKLSGTVPTWNQDTTGNAGTVTNGVYTSGSYTDPSWLTITYDKLTGSVPIWNQDTSGNAATVTNGVYTTGTYDNPSWITHLAYSKLSGTVPTWNQDTTGNAATVTNGVYTTGSYSDPSWLTISKSKVGLGNVDNTADANKNVLYADTAGSAPASDVYAWAKAATKPSYTKSEVGLSDVENTALSTWAGSTNITTLGTITTGVWHGTAITNSYLQNSSVTIGSTSLSLGSSSTTLAGLTSIDATSGSTSFFATPTSPALFAAGTAVTIGATTGTTTVRNDLTVSGNLTVNGSQQFIQGTNTVYTDNLIELHAPTGGVGASWTSDDGKDIGFRFHYYNVTDKNAALLFANDSQSMEFYLNGTETDGVFSGTYGSFKGSGFIFTGSTSGTTLLKPAAAASGTLTLPAATDTLVGKATTDTLTNKTIAAGSNTISGLTNGNLSGSAGITNANLANSSVTIGTTAISLGSSSTTLAGLTSVSSTSFVGTLTGNADTVTNGVYTSGSYANPSWITSLAYSKLSGTVPTWNQDTTGNAATVTNGVYTTGSYTDPTWLTITKSKVGLGNVENTALSTWAGTTNITTIGAATATSLVVTGNLTVNGTSVTIADKNIELGSVASPTDTTANGGGITLRGTSDKTFNWVSGTTAWTSSEHLNLLIGKAYYINGVSVLNSTTLGSGITSSSLTSVGTITTGVWNASAIANIYLQNSTISGVSLGQSLNALTIGTGLSGTSYNGSSAVTIALATAYGDTQNPYGSKTANYFLAAPNGSAGAPSFRAIVAADIPTLNQNTTGSAGSVANAHTAGTGLSGSTYNGSAAVTWNLANTTVTAGSYTTANITVDAQGRITAASNGSSQSWLFKTANYTAVDGDRIIADTTVSGSFTITLPASPVLGTQITLADGNSWANANLTVARNGKTIKGLAEDLTVDIAGIKVDLLYSGSTWLVYAFAAPTVSSSATADSLIFGGSSLGLWS